MKLSLTLNLFFLFFFLQSNAQNFDGDIVKNEGVPFIHITRECGTHITTFHPSEEFPEKDKRVPYLFNATANRVELLDSKVETFDYYLKNDALAFHYYDGKKLMGINSRQAVSFVDKYRYKILTEWGEKAY